MVLLQRPRNLTLLTKYLDLLQSRRYGTVQITYVLQQRVCLRDLIRCFIKTPLRSVNTAIALIDIALQVTLVVVFVAEVAAFLFTLVVLLVGFQVCLFTGT